MVSCGGRLISPSSLVKIAMGWPSDVDKMFKLSYQLLANFLKIATQFKDFNLFLFFIMYFCTYLCMGFDF